MITMSRQLEELGFTKKTCITCGNDFWSIDERKTCGDAPCDEYAFIGNPATSKKYDLYQIQKEFINFFNAKFILLSDTKFFLQKGIHKYSCQNNKTSHIKREIQFFMLTKDKYGHNDSVYRL